MTKLYPHNQIAYENIQRVWKDSNRCAVVQPTGSGKGVLVIHTLLQDFKGRSKLIVTPSNYILQQFQNGMEGCSDTTYLTYQKLALMSQDEVQNLHVSIIVLDEFHRCGADQWSQGVGRLLDTFPNAKVLGTSATPIRYLDNGRDMADELFGDNNIAVNMTLAEAFAQEIVPFPVYVSALYSMDDEIKKLKQKIQKSANSDESKSELTTQLKLMKQNLKKSKGIPQILKKYLNNKSGKFIVFCKDVEHLERMKSTVTGWFQQSKINKDVHTYVSHTKYEGAALEYESFKNDHSDSIRLLFSIGQFNEGVHLDDITGVILLRCTQSPILYLQQIGRAIDAGQKPGESIIFDFVNNFDNVECNNLIGDIETAIEKNKAENELIDWDGSNRHKKEIPDISRFRIYDEIQDVKKLFGDLEARLVDGWDVMFQRLIDYKERFGDCDVAKGFEYGKLAGWVKEQRKIYKRGILLKHREELLLSVGFCFGMFDKKWNNFISRLSDYVSKYNALPQFNFVCDDEFCLGIAVSKKRIAYKEGKLNPERIKAIEDVCPDFFVSPYSISFDTFTSHLQSYVDEYKTLPPYSYIAPDLYPIGKSVNTKRQFYKKGKLSQFQINEILSIYPDFFAPRRKPKPKQSPTQQPDHNDAKPISA